MPRRNGLRLPDGSLVKFNHSQRCFVSVRDSSQHGGSRSIPPRTNDGAVERFVADRAVEFLRA